MNGAVVALLVCFLNDDDDDDDDASGEDLDARLRRLVTLSEREARSITLQMLEALNYLHNQQVRHRFSFCCTNKKNLDNFFVLERIQSFITI